MVFLHSTVVRLYFFCIFFLSFYRIIVVMVDGTISDKKLEDIFNTKESDLWFYKDWLNIKNKTGVPYIALAFKGELFDTKEDLVVIGSGETFDNTLVRRKKRNTNVKPKNGKLIPGKQYAVAVRGYTEKVHFLQFYFVETNHFYYTGCLRTIEQSNPIS